MSFFKGVSGLALDGVEAAFAGADADNFFDVGDEDLAVADTAGGGSLADGFDGAFNQGIVEREVFVNEETQKQEIETEMSLIQLGPIQLLTIPGELLPELAIGGYDGSHINAPGVPLIHEDNENPPKIDEAPAGPYIKDRMTGTYRWLIGLGNDELGYIIPPYNWELADSMPWVNEAPGHHYEETNSLGPDMGPLVDTWTDYLLAWAAKQ